jgi:pimeloyl-ACP methyl ester carboxylesterase
MRQHSLVGHRLAALVALLGVNPLNPAHAVVAAQSLTLQPCELDGVREQLRCGTFDVWENRVLRGGRKIALRVVLLPALDSAAARDPVVVLQGGPGQSNVSTIAGFSDSPLRSRRAFLFVDLRGTGSSAVLDCDFSNATGARSDFLPLDGVRACRDSLARGADLAQYTTPVVIEDLEEVFTALGLGRVNLMGFSGGTRHALAFMRRYPTRVRSALLHGPVPLDARIPLTFAQDAQLALDGVLNECRSDSACARRFPTVRADFDSVVQRLSRAPAEIRMRRGATELRLAVTRSAFAQVIRYMLYLPLQARAIPLVVHRAALGDFSLIAERVRTLGIPAGVAYGFYLSNTCSEDVPWFDLQDALTRARDTYLGDYRVRQQRAACEGWPRGALPAGYLDPVRSDIPTLVLVGEHDPVTPARWGHEVVRHLSSGRVLVVPQGGHSFAGLLGQECLDGIRERFVQDAAPAALDTSCMERVRRPAFLLDERAATTR